MSSLIGLLTLVLYISLVYLWYRCHKQLRAKGYGHGLITTAFVVLVFVSLMIGGGFGTENDALALVPPSIWIAGALGLTRVLPARKRTSNDGRVERVGKRHAGPRRASKALVRAWLTIVTGGVIGLFMLGQLTAPTTSSRETAQILQALPFLLGATMIIAGYWFGVARRTKQAPEKLDTSTPSVLYLRAFAEEQRPFVFGPAPALKRYTNQLSAQLFQKNATLKLTLEDYLEEAITAQLGPFVGLGNPHDKLTPDGATREYAPDGEWQTRFFELARTASCIVVSIGGSMNLQWELKQIKDQGFGQKLCLFTSPIVPGTDTTLLNRFRRTASKRSAQLAADWSQSIDVLRRAGFNCSTSPGPGAAVTFDEQGNGTLITTDATAPDEFIAPVADWFKEGRKSGRCLPVACRTCGATTHVTTSGATGKVECYVCRQKAEHAAKPFVERHSVVISLWGAASLFIAVIIAQAWGVLGTSSGWFVLPLWAVILFLPLVVGGLLASRRARTGGHEGHEVGTKDTKDTKGNISMNVVHEERDKRAAS